VLGKNTSSSRSDSGGDTAEDDLRHSILQLNTEGLTANKNGVIEQSS